VIQRDYILRLIEQLGALLRALAGSKGDVKKPERAISDASQSDAALEKACQEGIGLSFRIIKEMAPDDLVELLRSGGATWVSRCFFVARLFEFDAEFARRVNQRNRAKQSIQRALYFYDLLRLNPEVPDEYCIGERFQRAVKLLAEVNP
jgi:hypothetical protein